MEDPYLWISKAINDDRCEYYKYVLLYVDHYLFISGLPREALEEINKYFTMKDFSIGPPKIYLEVNVGKVQLPNVVEAYSISMIQYLPESINNVDK